MKQFSFILLFFVSAAVFAQPVGITQKIIGRVLDNETLAPLAYAEVFVSDLPEAIGTQAGEDGYFTLENVPIGKRTIQVSMLGYEPFTLPNVELTSGKAVVLELKLQQQLVKTNEVVITGEQAKERTQNEMITVSGRTFSLQEANRYASGFGDLTRMAQAFAGVASADGTSNNIIIRGNNPQGMLWMLEGIEVSNPNHFPQGDAASGGGISILESTVITNSDFLTGAFPAEYGNAVSGVFDVKLRQGNPEKREHSVQLSTIGLTAMSEGPMWKSTKARNSYLAKYRYSTLSLMALTGLDFFGSVAPTYQDLTVNLNFSTPKLGTFSLFAVGGWATSGNKAKTDSTGWEKFDDKLNYRERYGTGIVGLKHGYLFPNNKLTMTNHLLYNISHIEARGDTLNNEYENVNYEQSRRTYQTLRFAHRYAYKPHPRHFFKAGAIVSVPFFDLFSAYRLPNGTYFQEYDANNSATYMQAFVSHKYKAGTRWELNSGLHLLYFFLNQQYALEPRLGARFRLTPKQSLSFATAIHSKIEPVSVYFLNVYDKNGNLAAFNRDLKLRKAAHFVLGYDFPFYKDFRLKTELYYQYLYDIPVANDSASYFSLVNSYNIKQELVNKGTAANYGWEFTIEKFYAQRYYFLSTISLFNSTYKTLSGKTFNTLYNGNYIVNVGGGKDFLIGGSEDKTFGLNSRLILMGGNRRTPIDLEKSQLAGKTVYEESRTYAERFAPFFRWDLGLYYQVNKKSYSWKLSTDIQNVTARKNPVQYYYDPRSRQIEYSYGLGFIPTINWKVDF